jgi:hypothetical protein
MNKTNPKCTEVMDAFFALDKGERLPLSMTLHLLTCKGCGNQVRLCTLAERASARPLTSKSSEAEVAALMAKLRAELPFHEEEHYLSLPRWIGWGMAMVAAMLLFPFIIPVAVEPFLHLAFYLVFAGVITAYCAFFVASNMDFFVKKIETIAMR